MAQKYLVRHGDTDVTIELERDGDAVLARYDGQEAWRRVALSPVGDSGLSLLMLDDRPVELYLDRRRGGATVTIGRHILDVDVSHWRAGSGRYHRERKDAGASRITAPMTGSIVEVRCSIGDAVHQGDVLLVIESMKMNNELRSPMNGVVEALPLEAGQRIKAGDLLVALRPEA
jgi:acetyl/propionyl-CoA carboxylase alpha subunit